MIDHAFSSSTVCAANTNCRYRVALFPGLGESLQTRLGTESSATFLPSYIAIARLITTCTRSLASTDEVLNNVHVWFSTVAT